MGGDVTASQAKTVDGLLKTAGAVLLAAVAFFLKSAWDEIQQLSKDQVDIDRRVVRIESNRFTVSEGKELWKAIASIQATMSKQGEKLVGIEKTLIRIEKSVERLGR